MERPAGWKVLTLGVALAGIGVAGAGSGTALDNVSPSTAPTSVSPATLFDQPQVLASGGGWGHGHGHGHWGARGQRPLLGAGLVWISVCRRMRRRDGSVGQRQRGRVLLAVRHESAS